MKTSGRCAFEAFETAWLRGVFMRALSAALASSLGGAACGGGEDEVTCGGVKTPLALSELEPNKPADYLSLRNGAPGSVITSEIRSSGEPCQGATDVAACESNLQSLLSQPPPAQSGGYCGQAGCSYLFTTSGDDAERYATQREIVEFLAPIDTPADARLLLEWAGYGLCAGVGIESASGGFEATASKMVDDCPVVMKRVRLLIRTSGELVELESEPLPSSGACIGRRPAGFICAETARGGSELAKHFARIAELEAASVAAFEVIAAELQHYAAPSELIAEARAAATDEVRHACATARLARRFGAVACAPRIEAQPLRSLEAFAEDNATEGCVRETFGALIGHYQAAAARDPEIAAVMREIAEDETRHAALSHRIARWAEPKLSAAAQERVATARGVAVAQLFQELQAGEPAADVKALAGVPDSATALTLFGNMASAILYERG